MWHNDIKVNATFTANGFKDVWAHIGTVGWRKVKTDAAVNVSNLYTMLSTAHAHGRLVNAHLDGNEIDIAYLK